MMLNEVENTIMLLLSMGAKATTCFVPKASIHLALLTTNPIILKAVFKAGGPLSYILFDEVLLRCLTKNFYIILVVTCMVLKIFRFISLIYCIWL